MNRPSPAPPHPAPLARWPVEVRADLIGVFTDIDDTLTSAGAITPDALGALHALRAAGLRVIAITGRPMGWSEPFAARWPLDAIVVENGAAALIPQRNDTGGPATAFGHEIGRQPAYKLDAALSKRYQQDAPERAANQVRLQQVLERVEREVPGAVRAADSAGRECDIAIDHSEFNRLGDAQIAQVLTLMRAEGLHASVSSIHINGWIGAHDKFQGACWMVRELWGRELNAERDAWCCVGDSTNDALMFAAFANSIGVANVARFAPQLASLNALPRYVTSRERGAGFAQVAAAVLAARTR